MSQKSTNARNGDLRFSNFETDPRFRLPSKRQGKTTIDKRFSRMLKDKDFTETAKVDRFGRKLKSDSKKKALQRLYEEEEEEKEDDDEDDFEVDDDDVVERELQKADAKYDPARGGGFSSSESDSDGNEEEDEEEEEDDGAQSSTAPDMQKFRTEQADIPTGDVTRRFAVVNFDFDNSNSIDLLALFSSFAPAGGRVEKVSIFPSEFGKERMRREEMEGPPKEIFKSEGKEDEEDDSEEDSEDEQPDDSDNDEEDSDEEAKKQLLEEGNDEDFDRDKLRAYQLDRLKYYYAVVECSSEATAKAIYDATDGREYLSSSNFLDLRFVPDEETFNDNEARDTCNEIPSGYKARDFVTSALSHSNVTLTWDQRPEELERKETIKNAFSGSRTDIAENDLRAYLASDSEESDAEEVVQSEEAEPKLSKKELARRKMREALGLSDDTAPKSSKSGPVGDMQVTFTPALTESKAPKVNETEETTIEKYKRKERERKAKRKASAKSKGADEAAGDEPEEDLGFDDPFFTSEEHAKTKTSIRKEERLKKREAREAEEAEKAAEKAELELLMADNDDQVAHLDHFDMKEIVKAEKRKNKKKKGKKVEQDQGGLQQDFDLDVADPRFKAVFDDHQFAIDPSNPSFKATGGMKKLLEEGRKKRRAQDDFDDDETGDAKSIKKVKAGQGELGGLVDSIKRKSKNRER